MANLLELIPGYQTAKALSGNVKASILQKEVDRQNEEISKRRTKLLDMAKNEVDENKKRIYLEQANSLKNTALEDLNRVISSQPTAKQVVASSAELALTLTGGSLAKAASGGYKVLKTGQLATKAQTAATVFDTLTKGYEAKKKFEQASKAGKALQIGKSVLGSATEGAAFGALGEAAINPEATLKSTAESALITAALGGGLNLSGRGIGAGLEWMGEKGNKKLKNTYDFFKTKLDDFSKGKLPEDTAINKIKNTIEKETNIFQKASGKIVDLLDGGEKTIVKFFDRFDPLKKMEEVVWKAKGLPLEDKEKIYTQVRLLNSKVDDTTIRELEDFTSKINKFPNAKEDSKVYLKALDDYDRAQNGQLLKVVGGKSVKVSPEEAYNNLQEVVGIYNAEGKLDDLENIRNIWKEQTDSELTKMRDAGLITDDEIAALQQAHPNYIPHDVVLDTQKKAYSKSSLNVSEDGLKRAMGSIREIKDPYQALGARTQILNRRIAQNNLLKNLVDTGQKYGVDGFRPIQTAENVSNKRKLLKGLKDKTQLNEQLRLLKVDKKLDSKLSSDISSLKKEAISEYNKIAKKIDVSSEEISPELQNNFDNFNSIIDKIENKVEGSNLAKDVIGEIKDEISKIREDRKNTWLEALKLSKKDIGSGEETINLFNNGIKETWVAPKDIVEAIKGTDVIPPSGVLKFVSGTNKFFKAMTTTFNPSFSVPNKFRDEQTALITADSFIQEMARKTGVTPRDVNLTKDELVDLWKKSGGIGANVYKDGEEAIFRGLEDAGIMKFVKDPSKALSALSDFFEQTTRLEVFKRGLQNGLSADDAALVARDATIDFAKMGTTMQTLNQVIPFLNARLQGFVNLGTAIKNNPEMFMRTQMLTAVYPAMALDKWNSQWDSYNNISQEIKNKYWIIVMNEIKTKDENGDDVVIPQFITIPKGEGQTLVANPVQYYLERARTKDPRSVTKMLVDTIGSASPLEFQRFSSDNPLLSTLSQFGTIGTLTGGYLSGKDPYFGTDLYQQSKEGAYNYLQSVKTTPEYLNSLSKTIANPDDNGKPRGVSISPSTLNFTINALGGVPQSISKIADLIYGTIKGEKPTKQKTETAFGAATQLPIVERFAKEAYPYYSPESQGEKKRAEEVTTEEKSKKVIKKEDLNNAVQDFIDAKNSGDYNKDQLKEYWNNYIVGSYKLSDEDQLKVFNDIKSIVEGTKSGRVGQISTSQSVEVRARLIYEKYKKIKQEEGQEAAKKFQQELIDKKILTEDVFKYMSSDEFQK